MATYQIIQPNNAATTYNLSDGTYTKVVFVDGIGMAGAQRITDGYPAFEGHRDFGGFIQPRELQLKLFYKAGSLALADARRDAIYRIFRPFDLPLKLKLTRDDGNIRQIDCHTLDANDLSETDRVGDSQIFTIKLWAPNQFWYDPTQITKTITPSATTWNDTITYSGNRADFPIVKVYGQVTNFTMTLATSFGTYTITIPSIATGTNWTLDCRPGYKTIFTSAGVPQLNTVDANTLAALYGLRIASANFTSGGINTFNGSYSTKDANHKVEILYYHKYGNA